MGFRLASPLECKNQGLKSLDIHTYTRTYICMCDLSGFISLESPDWHSILSYLLIFLLFLSLYSPFLLLPSFQLFSLLSYLLSYPPPSFLSMSQQCPSHLRHQAERRSCNQCMRCFSCPQGAHSVPVMHKLNKGLTFHKSLLLTFSPLNLDVTLLVF